MRFPKLYISDIKSGFFIFLIALPLCLGIAMASGCPPVAGLFTAIVGGLIASFIGSARLTIKGPAAGLIVIVLAASQALGYRGVLAVSVAAALIQILLSIGRAGRLGAAIPPSVVHGMLAGIGVIIIAKQIHLMLGAHPHGMTPLALLHEIPDSVLSADRHISILGLITLIGLFVFPKLPALNRVPAALLSLMIVVPLGIHWHLDDTPQYLVNIPREFLSAMTFPDWLVLGTWLAWKHVLLFAIVGTVESLLTVTAVDSIDPEKRPSDLDKDLFSVGVGNAISGLIGGLPMISEIVRSKANIDSGAKGVSSNFYHGVLLLGALTLIPGVIHEIPLAALAAMLVVTGSRLASPKQFLHAHKAGLDQLAVFTVTMSITVGVDLLAGVMSGIMLEATFHLARGVPLSSFWHLPCKVTQSQTGERVLRPDGPCVFSNLPSFLKALNGCLAQPEPVAIDFSQARFVDYATLERVRAMIAIAGIDRLQTRGLPRKESIAHGTEKL